MATKVGSLLADLGLSTANFESGVKRAKKSFSSLRRGISKRVKGMRRSLNNLSAGFAKLAAVILAVAGPAAMIALTISTAKALDEQQKFARVIGTTQAELAGLGLAAKELSGVTQNTLNMALQRMTRRIGEAAVGTGEAKQAIIDLGLDAKKLAQQDPAQSFRDISDAMQDVPGDAEKLRLSFKLFDSEGARLVTTLTQGSEALLRYRQTAIDLGLTLSEGAIVQIEAMNDAVGRAKMATTGFFNQLNVALSPILTQIANDFTDVRLGADNLGKATGGIEMMTRGVGVLLDAIRNVKIAYTALWTFATKVAQGAAFVSNFITGTDYQRYIDQANDASAALDNLLTMTLPSDALDAWLANARGNMKLLVAEHKQTTLAITKGSDAAAAKQQDIYARLGDSIVRDYDNAMGAVLGVFRDTLAKMAAEWLASGIRGLFSGGSGGGGSGGGGIISGIKSLFGFAAGGSFKVGGAGGTDSKTVAFRATPGEIVSVKTPAQQKGSGNVTIVNNNDFSGRGAVDIETIKVLLAKNREVTIATVRDLVLRQRFA